MDHGNKVKKTQYNYNLKIKKIRASLI